MFKRILPLVSRNLPKVTKVAAFTFGLLLVKNQTKLLDSAKCVGFPTFTHNTNIFAEVLPKIIRIQRSGEIIGFAYCLDDKHMVSPSHELSDKRLLKSDNLQFFIGDSKIKAKVSIVGRFENLTFLESDQAVLPILPSKSIEMYSPVHIVQNRTYLGIRDGYFVGQESGFGIVNGKGQVGSLVLNNDGVVGIVTHIGRDYQQGYLRIALWKDIKNCINRVRISRQEGLYLGISVVATNQNSGVSVVRVAPKSPLINHIKMGDIVTKINNIVVKNPDDLTRLIMFSDHEVLLQVESADKTRRNITLKI